ncbi:HNH endonuclease [Cyanobacteria bacterium FACHB-63]|nr:HNH endonuclease [Cyanobacteria bacterium FACHB-63]
MNFATQSFSVEHILPRAKGGLSELENLALSCQGCNNHKSTKIEGFDPVAKQTVSLFRPRVQQWRDHFAWNEDYTIVIGTTSTGRATVNELNLNRLGLINLRRVLFASGEHPPSDTLP